MTDESKLPRITTRIVYLDLPDMIELQTQVVAGRWGACANVYASPDGIRDQAKSLLLWCEHRKGEAIIETGTPAETDRRTGLMRMRFYAIDQLGHLVCHIQLATMFMGSKRPESIRRFSMEMPTETAAVERYARHLQAIVETLNEEAVLLGIES